MYYLIPDVMFRDFIEGYKKILHFHGRASRKAYWRFILLSIMLLGTIWLTLVPYAMRVKYNSTLKMWEVTITNQALFLLYQVFLICKLLSVFSYTARRLHDVGRSAWWLMVWVVSMLFMAALPLVTLVAALYLIYVCTKQGMVTANKYGAVPLDR